MSINILCRLFGKTRQGYYLAINNQEKNLLENHIIIEMVLRLRKRVKTNRWGGRKLYSLLKEEFNKHGIKIGRDKFFDLLREESMLVKPRKRHYHTTQSSHWLHKHPYLIDQMKLTKPNELWVSDITYVTINNKVMYLYLITDAYSKMIVGWYLSSNLKAVSAVMALKQALKNNKDNQHKLIHHSDRGVQYCSKEYVNLLNKNKVIISMTHGGSPGQNTIAERINGIIKQEWIYDLKITKNQKIETEIKKIIKIYNTIRPHQSINYNTPAQVHQMGFLRHKIESVIVGKMYKPKKAGLIKTQPTPTDASKLQLFLTSCSTAELVSASLQQNKN